MRKYSWLPDMWIEDLVKNKTFIDVGGVAYTCNEKISIAHESGAKDLTMLDIAGLYDKSKIDADDGAWLAFHQRMKEKKIENYHSIKANIDNVHLGIYDLVYCNGVIYHTPNPLYTLKKISNITKKYLILGTTRIPERIEIEGNILESQPSSCLFVPNLNLFQKEILSKFFISQGDHRIFHGINKEVEWSYDQCNAWWNVMTDGFVEGMLKTLGFQILETLYFWGEAARYYLCEKNTKIKNM